MEIHALSDTGLMLKFPDGVVAVNPPEPTKKAVLPNIILTTYPIPIAGWGSVWSPEPGQKVFSGPGEYEKDNIVIHGYHSETTLQGQRMQTTSWLISSDGVRVLVLGDIDDKKDLQHITSEVGTADVLVFLCPQDGEKRLGAPVVAGAAARLSAQRIIPIGTDGDLQQKIASEIGVSNTVVGKYVLKKKDLLAAQVQTVLFS